MLDRRVLVGRPRYLRIHPARQPVHQPADFFRTFRRVERIDAVSLEALRGFWRAEKVSKAGRRPVVIDRIADRNGLRNRECARLGCFLHGSFLPAVRMRDWGAGREIIVSWETPGSAPATIGARSEKTRGGKVSVKRISKVRNFPACGVLSGDGRLASCR
jgi:hypothetical protein